MGLRQESEACGTCISKHNKGLENGERVSSREGVGEGGAASNQRRRARTSLWVNLGGGVAPLSSVLTRSMKNRFRFRACSDAKLPFRASLPPNNLAR